MKPEARETVIYYIYYFYHPLINEWIEWKPFWVTVPKLPSYYIKLESHTVTKPKRKLSTYHLLANRKSECNIFQIIHFFPFSFVT